jgi:hypothetical protein
MHAAEILLKGMVEPGRCPTGQHGEGLPFSYEHVCEYLARELDRFVSETAAGGVAIESVQRFAHDIELRIVKRVIEAERDLRLDECQKIISGALRELAADPAAFAGPTFDCVCPPNDERAEAERQALVKAVELDRFKAEFEKPLHAALIGVADVGLPVRTWNNVLSEMNERAIDVTGCHDCPFFDSAPDAYLTANCLLAIRDDDRSKWPTEANLNVACDRNTRPKLCPLDGLDLGVIVRAKR